MIHRVSLALLTLARADLCMQGFVKLYELGLVTCVNVVSGQRGF